ncbi:MAG: hypothetical protein F4181_07055 [Proteobacteria bacterium]|nr:hypothetical protein [Pseudomonadota bacterium]
MNTETRTHKSEKGKSMMYDIRALGAPITAHSVSGLAISPKIPRGARLALYNGIVALRRASVFRKKHLSTFTLIALTICPSTGQAQRSVELKAVATIVESEVKATGKTVKLVFGRDTGLPLVGQTGVFSTLETVDIEPIFSLAVPGVTMKDLRLFVGGQWVATNVSGNVVEVGITAESQSRNDHTGEITYALPGPGEYVIISWTPAVD